MPPTACSSSCSGRHRLYRLVRGPRTCGEPGLIGTLVATDADAALARAAELGIVDDAITDFADAVKGADLVVLCTPVRTYRALAETMAPALAPGVIVTDAGSVKSSVVRQVTPRPVTRR